jgi:hypothetical protein
MCYTLYRILVCSCTKIRMISSLRNFSVRILDADRFTIMVFQILDIKSNYLPGIVQRPAKYVCPAYRTSPVVLRLRMTDIFIAIIHTYSEKPFLELEMSHSYCCTTGKIRLFRVLPGAWSIF